ncbi:YceI family protein [Fluviibacterium sp. DFM31]|uniref:YceI family protein n=1 Tax=Meridianimarinicoccus marinus TaxID=3231483 RepID=A0ABV3L5U5_9RHOB
MRIISLVAGLSLLAGPLFAWTLDNAASSISYVTTKNGSTSEANLLSDLSGTVGDDGTATVEISLGSVETFIDIRNERMREFVFKVVDFPIATVSAALDPAAMAGMAPGSTTEASFEVTVAANGTEASYEATAYVTQVGEDRVLVASKAPIIVHAEDLGYDEGISKLQEIAGLDSIEPTVPVAFHLVFDR